MKKLVLAILCSTVSVHGMELNFNWDQWNRDRACLQAWANSGVTACSGLGNMAVGQCKNLVNNVVNNPLDYIGKSPKAVMVKLGVTTFKLVNMAYRLQVRKQALKVNASLDTQELSNDILGEEDSKEEVKCILSSEDDEQSELIIYMEDSDNIVNLQDGTICIQDMASNSSWTQRAVNRWLPHSNYLINDKIIEDCSNRIQITLNRGEKVCGRVGRFLAGSGIIVIGVATSLLASPVPVLLDAQLVLLRRALNQIAAENEEQDQNEEEDEGYEKKVCRKQKKINLRAHR